MWMPVQDRWWGMMSSQAAFGVVTVPSLTPMKASPGLAENGENPQLSKASNGSRQVLMDKGWNTSVFLALGFPPGVQACGPPEWDSASIFHP